MIVVFVIVLAVAACAAQPAQPFEQDGRWGYKTAQGRVVIQPRFAVAKPFSPEGIAAVVDKQGWAYVDRNGKLVIRPYVFDNGPDSFADGLARFTAGGKFGFFDKHGRVVIRLRFTFAAPFSEGRAVVCDGCREVAEGEHKSIRGGRWGFIERTGALVIPLQFEEAESFDKGTARVKLDGKWKRIDSKGGTVEEPSIGVATMEADGTIVLQLRAEGPGGIRGDAVVRYPVGHPQYQEIIRHLGGLTKGQTKPVPPWPEK